MSDRDDAAELLVAQLAAARQQAIATVRQLDVALRLLGAKPDGSLEAPKEPERTVFNRPRRATEDALLDRLADAASLLDPAAAGAVVTDPEHSPASVT